MIKFNCPICRIDFMYRERNRKYCSRKCMSLDPKRKITGYINGKKNKGKIHIRKPSGKYTFQTINTRGYRMIKKRFHPTADKRGYIMEHRLIMEQHLGRLLSPREKIHHLNGNKLDNRISNLELCASQKEHTIKHKLYPDGQFQTLRNI